ncbi:MAG: hypothetical protein BWY72_00529 [Bacteroidetes bacterium ADurb.Bin416]|nr:MAG: hypothetical protein BWY72_00529 [Bacteroidetes bacterium ADurb.Bin416]
MQNKTTTKGAAITVTNPIPKAFHGFSAIILPIPSKWDPKRTLANNPNPAIINTMAKNSPILPSTPKNVNQKPVLFLFPLATGEKTFFSTLLSVFNKISPFCRKRSPLMIAVGDLVTVPPMAEKFPSIIEFGPRDISPPNAAILPLTSPSMTMSPPKIAISPSTKASSSMVTSPLKTTKFPFSLSPDSKT